MRCYTFVNYRLAAPFLALALSQVAISNLAQGFSVMRSNILATPPTNTLTLPTTNPGSWYRLRF